jgi:hypothetical protein
MARNYERLLAQIAEEPDASLAGLRARAEAKASGAAAKSAPRTGGRRPARRRTAR